MADAAPELVPFRWNAERLARHRLMEALHQADAADETPREWCMIGPTANTARSINLDS
jgi:hypothetical protein